MEITNIKVMNATHGKFYILDNVIYDIHFPLNWALNPEKTSEGFICGPSYCQNCYKYGSYNGVFIGYCVPCAGMYSYERGNGFIYSGEEIVDPEDYEYSETSDYRPYSETSAWNTYLKGVNRDQIGWGPEEEKEDKPQKNEDESPFRDSLSESSEENYADYVDSESEHYPSKHLSIVKKYKKLYDL